MKYSFFVSVNKKFYGWEDCYRHLGEILLSEKKVKPGFINSVLSREKDYPTGLQISSQLGIAIPHPYDPSLTVEPSIATAILSEPITASSMADSDECVSVSIVFLLALKASNEHLKLLERIMETCQDEQFLINILRMTDESLVKNALIKKLALNDFK